jgi:hypothetical protein
MPTDRSQYQKRYRQLYKTRHKRVTVVYGADEYGRLEADAAKAQVSLASLVRARSLEEPLQGPANSAAGAPGDVVKELRFLLRNVANNMNQIAYHSNRLRMVMDENEPLLRLQQLENDMIAILERYRPDDH